MLRDIDEEKVLKAKNRRHSVSSLDLFKNCPHNYYLKYVCGNYGEFSPDHLTVGTSVHKAMEMKVKGETNQKIIKMLKDEVGHITEYRDRVKKFISKYVLDADYIKGYEVLGVELPFEMKIEGRPFIGAIDLIIKHKETGEISVIDYKTSKKIHSDDKLKGFQTLIYAHVVDKLFGRVDKVIYDFVFLEIKQVVEIDIKKNNKSLKTRLRNVFKKMDKAFETGEFIPSPSILCGWCNFRSYSNPDQKTCGLCKFEGIWDYDFKTLFKKNIYVSIKDEEEILGDLMLDIF